MRRKIYAIAVCAVMLVGLLPASAFAATDKCPEIKVDNQTQKTPGTLTLGKYKENDGKIMVSGDDDAGYVITLDNVNITVPYELYGINIDSKGAPYTVKLVGANEIDVSGDPDAEAALNINNGTITSEGDGKLTATGGYYGVSGSNYEIKDAEITATGSENGISAEGTVTLSGKSKVEAHGEEDCGIFASYEVIYKLTPGGKVTAVGGVYAVYTGSVDTIELDPDNIITTPVGGVIVKRGAIAFIAQSDGRTPATTAVVENTGSTPAPEVQDTSAETGDMANIPLFILLGLSAILAGGIVLRRRA